MAVTSDTRTRLSAEQRREQLLDATKTVVGAQGFHGASIDAVAKRAGVSRPIVYSHFGDLGSLLETMLERESESALRQLADVLPTELESSDPREALLSALRAYLEVVRADPVTWRLVLMPPEGAPQLLRDQITRGRDAVIDVLAAAVEQGASPGPASPDPELTARMLSAVADESARLLLTHPGRFSIDRLTRHAGWLLDQLDA
jgi:AcrR family transcriptional regulator